MAHPIKTSDLQDGDPLGDGLVVSDRGGFMCAVYRCKCGREQKAECETFDGGIGPQAAQSVGWQINYNEYGWICPFCSGQTDKLFEVFNRKVGKEA